MKNFLDRNMDRSHSNISATQDASSEVFGVFIKNINLYNIWRVINPNVKEFTFYLAPHKMPSRID